MIEKFPSVKFKNQIPDFFLKDGELLYKFMQYYFEWLESYENPVYVARRFREYMDVDTAPDKFFAFLRDQFMQNIPPTEGVNERQLLKNIKDFYRSKGSEKALKLLFRILYSEEIDVYYPGDDILRASAGHWIKERSIKTELIDTSFNKEDDYIEIIGSISGTTARLTRSLTYVEDEQLIYEMFITSVRGEFYPEELILDNTNQKEIIAQLRDVGIIEHPGRWEGTYGFLSSDKYLQDNYYYQEYSYVIRSSQSITFYKDAVQNLNHPAGTLMFGSIQIRPDLLASMEVETSSQYSMTLNILFDFEVLIIVGFGDSVSDKKLIFNIVLDMYYVNDWVYNKINGNGQVSVNQNKKVSGYSSDLVSDFWNVPAYLMGSLRLLHGSNTSFIADGIGSGSVLDIWHPSDSNRHLAMVRSVFSNKLLSVESPLYALIYQYNYEYSDGLDNIITIMSGVTTANVITGTMDLFQSGAIDLFGAYYFQDYLDVPIESVGSGVFIRGTGTNFLTDLTPEIPITFYDGTASLVFSGVVDEVLSNTVATLKDAYTGSPIFNLTAAI